MTPVVTAEAIIDKIREVCATRAEQINPEAGWEQASLRYAYQNMLAFTIAPQTIVVGTVNALPSNLEPEAMRAWDATAGQAATNAVDLATEALGISGEVVADNPFSIIFRF